MMLTALFEKSFRAIIAHSFKTLFALNEREVPLYLIHEEIKNYGILKVNKNTVKTNKIVGIQSLKRLKNCLIGG